MLFCKLLFHTISVTIVPVLIEKLLSPEAAATPAKRKAESKNDTPAAKKAKADGEGRNDALTSPLSVTYIIRLCNYEHHVTFNFSEYVPATLAYFLSLTRILSICWELKLQQRL